MKGIKVSQDCSIFCSLYSQRLANYVFECDELFLLPLFSSSLPCSNKVYLQSMVVALGQFHVAFYGKRMVSCHNRLSLQKESALLDCQIIILCRDRALGFLGYSFSLWLSLSGRINRCVADLRSIWLFVGRACLWLVECYHYALEHGTTLMPMTVSSLMVGTCSINL